LGSKGKWNWHNRFFGNELVDVLVDFLRHLFADGNQFGEEGEYRRFVGDFVFVIYIHVATVGIVNVHTTQVIDDTVGGVPFMGD